MLYLLFNNIFSSLRFYLLKMDEKKQRLRRLIEHWAKHNDEHGARFMESADEAKEMGLHEAATELKGAASKSRMVTGHLLEALKKMG